MDLAGLSIDRLTAWISSLGWLNLIKIVAQTVIILYALLWIRSRIRGTQAERLVKGILVLVGLCLLSWLAGFTIILSVLQQVIPVAVLALIIIFQPEIRRGLGYLGRGKGVKLDFTLADSNKDKLRIVSEQIVDAIRELARAKTGALIVVEPLDGERDYLSPGIAMNADVSSNLLLTIFFANSPLHDGAVVIRRDKVVAAGVILPITDNPKLSYRYGTRHRAAIGLSEIYDALCIVVSEETGFISAASHGMLSRYNSADELAQPLSYIYNIEPDSKAPSPLQSFLQLFSKNKRGSDIDTGGGTMPPEPPANLVKPEGSAGALSVIDNLAEAEHLQTQSESN